MSEVFVNFWILAQFRLKGPPFVFSPQEKKCSRTKNAGVACNGFGLSCLGFGRTRKNPSLFIPWLESPWVWLGVSRGIRALAFEWWFDCGFCAPGKGKAFQNSYFVTNLTLRSEQKLWRWTSLYIYICEYNTYIYIYYIHNMYIIVLKLEIWDFLFRYSCFI